MDLRLIVGHRNHRNTGQELVQKRPQPTMLKPKQLPKKYNEPVLNIAYQIQSIHTKKTIKLLSNFCLLYRGPYESNKSTVTSIPVVSQTTKSRPKSVTSPRPMSKEASEFAESGTYKPLYRRHSSY
ncbi:unnamed protein product [Rotaria magnacalcarata]|uniref:Uncharacterized protein n=1 Tax=Rotaria magnacalcarata TaxID=392030 RepID=A0A816RDV7_9BILA|nr:unnamed protein product [Rotaria magnacalcarata]